MQRFTISLDDELATQFDGLIARKGYVNRSEAVRDLIRAGLGLASLAADGPPKAKPWCVACVSYVYDHHDRTATARLADLQHDHHDLVITSLHTPLDHDDRLETVVLRGPLASVRACAEKMIAMRGVRHGHMHIVPLDEAAGGRHVHGDADAVHSHRKPIN
ncbi:MAG: nickel-responsive transcriptional regulator NikR [Comamonadaceae bacterium]|nr:MAG: nickel-responsive transcriptional regulator NikR [Comamonadaceae bacterium]